MISLFFVFLFSFEFLVSFWKRNCSYISYFNLRNVDFYIRYFFHTLFSAAFVCLSELKKYFECGSHLVSVNLLCNMWPVTDWLCVLDLLEVSKVLMGTHIYFCDLILLSFMPHFWLNCQLSWFTFITSPSLYRWCIIQVRRGSSPSKLLMYIDLVINLVWNIWAGRTCIGSLTSFKFCQIPRFYLFYCFIYVMLSLQKMFEYVKCFHGIVFKFLSDLLSDWLLGIHLNNFSVLTQFLWNDLR